MAKTKEPAASKPLAGYWYESRRPLTSLAFVAPLLLFYEIGVLTLADPALLPSDDLVASAAPAGRVHVAVDGPGRPHPPGDRPHTVDVGSERLGPACGSCSSSVSISGKTSRAASRPMKMSRWPYRSNTCRAW